MIVGHLTNYPQDAAHKHVVVPTRCASPAEMTEKLAISYPPPCFFHDEYLTNKYRFDTHHHITTIAGADPNQRM